MTTVARRPSSAGVGSPPTSGLSASAGSGGWCRFRLANHDPGVRFTGIAAAPLSRPDGRMPEVCPRAISTSLWRAAAPETIATCDGATLAHRHGANHGGVGPPAGRRLADPQLERRAVPLQPLGACPGVDAHGEPRPPAHRVPAATCRGVRNVIDHRSCVTGRMWCCHCVRAGPDRT
jgi:hypothetical protein